MTYPPERQKVRRHRRRHRTWYQRAWRTWQKLDRFFCAAPYDPSRNWHLRRKLKPFGRMLENTQARLAGAASFCAAFVGGFMPNLSPRFRQAFAAVLAVVLLLPVPAFATLNFAGATWSITSNTTGKDFFTIPSQSSIPSQTDFSLFMNVTNSGKFSGQLVVTSSLN